MCGTTLKSTPNDSDWCGNHESHLSSQKIAGPANENGTEKPTTREACIHSTDDSIGIRVQYCIARILGEAKIPEEAGLTKCGGDDAESIPIGQASKTESQYNLFVINLGLSVLSIRR